LYLNPADLGNQFLAACNGFRPVPFCRESGDLFDMNLGVREQLDVRRPSCMTRSNPLRAAVYSAIYERVEQGE
jgi:predicted RNase H-like nuclease